MIGVKRSEGAPRILVESTAADRYRHNDVVARLIDDFHNKCYICEDKPPKATEVEHLRPHKNDTIPGRKFDWNNLFLSCRHCNGVKNQARFEEHVIDCCRRDPETLLTQEVREQRVSVNAIDPEDEEARVTAELITEVFMYDGAPLRKNDAKAKLDGLQMTMNRLYRHLRAYCLTPSDPMAKKSLRLMLQRSAKFAGFTRCYVREHLDRYPGLAEYLV